MLDLQLQAVRKVFVNRPISGIFIAAAELKPALTGRAVCSVQPASAQDPHGLFPRIPAIVPAIVPACKPKGLFWSLGSTQTILSACSRWGHGPKVLMS